MNVNDEKPQIDRSNLTNNIEIMENESIDELILISATDEDDLGSISFSLENSDQDNYPFTLVPVVNKVNEAWLSVDGSKLDYEYQQFWYVDIVAKAS